MKGYQSLFLLAASALTMASCRNENFLDRFPQSSITEPTFFKNESDLKLYCNQFYTMLPVQRSYQSESGSDNFVPNSQDVFLSGQYIVPVSGGGWSWTNERNLNFFLNRYGKADASSAIKAKYAGEIRFFRAYTYWRKVVQFGDVPWLSKDLNDQSAELYDPKNSHKVVMDSVLADLNYAVENLPLPKDAEAGRLHKYAAAALKARISLWEGTFRKYQALGDEQKFLQEAVSAAELVAGSGLYDIWSTGNPNTDYYNLFIQEELNTNKEAILPMRYLKDILMHNLTRQLGESGTGYSKNFARAFLMKDGLPTKLSPLYKGDNTPDDEAANRDPRYKQLIGTKGFVFQIGATGTKDTINLPRIGTSLAPTGYQVIKGRSPDLAQWNANQSTLDLFIFRYAETLLILAEAKAELGQADQALLDRTVNKIRARVGMPKLTADVAKDPGSDFPALPALLDEIRRERRVELAADGFRMDDLLRWKAGKLIENPETILGMKLTPELRAQYPASQISGVVVDANQYIRIYTSVSARTWNDKMYLYPIPTQELTLNPKLAPQNPGW
ncbi:RagB/SusD family nutrient uptake outer membrane protein [Siphonobacter aquaeclarae]|uniref:Starch-binding associating with outer membrane n=1 Tax=Siphonobacter aquaeclarae TaxID=563176 RepID=A0A1G9HE61_9BACT|nr:RagB/SusD family nutrient uptake outer membrane protein [Siphonobacter aquaeclarae]SDL11348.1 Starch-binding associating with outer membrane [Siphonobacter aquaeclarae]